MNHQFSSDNSRFSTSMFDPETDRLIAKSILKNQASVEENPSLSRYCITGYYLYETKYLLAFLLIRFQRSCVAILAHLWNIPSNATFLGTATTGSSEAALLGGLSMKRNWQKKHPNGSTRPNVLIGDNAHICLKKFAEYFDVEIRPLRLGRRYAVESENLENQLDENTSMFYTLTKSSHEC